MYQHDFKLDTITILQNVNLTVGENSAVPVLVNESLGPKIAFVLHGFVHFANQVRGVTRQGMVWLLEKR